MSRTTALMGILVLSFLLVAHTSTIRKDNSGGYNDLLTWMEGSFSSIRQAQADSNYLHVKLEIKRIWQKEENGAWLYLEQAAAFAPDKPYIQRLYHITQLDDHRFLNQVYKLPNARDYIGGYAKPYVFNSLAKDSLIPMNGCGMELLYNAGVFHGTIPENSCQNNWGKAAYVTSVIDISSENLVVLNRGWSSEGEQVWGPKEGGYIFERRK